MTGSWSNPAVSIGLLTVTGTAGPAAIPLAGRAAASADVVGDKFAVPYTMQTGPIRYAPMQSFPGSSITATNTAPLWPTSSAVIAKTYLLQPNIQVTITQPGTYSFASHANTVCYLSAFCSTLANQSTPKAAAQSNPTDPMQKFLNRWKD
jgi:hypothetical protein